MKTLILCLSLLCCSLAPASADTWILRTADTKVMLKTSTRSDGFIPEASTTPNSEWVRIIQEARPVYNTATHKLVATAQETGSNPIVLTRGWTITALTQPELDAIAVRVNQATKRASVGGQVGTLRQWKTDADNALTSWDTDSTAQRMAKLKVVIDRFGKLSDKLADFIQAQGLDQ